MAADPQDWIDRALRQSAWEPPESFTDRMVHQAMLVLPRRASVMERLTGRIAGFRTSVRSRLACSAWVLAQYRELMFKSG